MTAHLLILYPTPKNNEAFERAYRDEHLPYAKARLAGATRVATKRVVGPAAAPPPYHLISEVSFPSIEVLKACATSAGGQGYHACRLDQLRRGTAGHGGHRRRLSP